MPGCLLRFLPEDSEVQFCLTGSPCCRVKADIAACFCLRLCTAGEPGPADIMFFARGVRSERSRVALPTHSAASEAEAMVHIESLTQPWLWFHSDTRQQVGTFHEQLFSSWALPTRLYSGRCYSYASNPQLHRCRKQQPKHGSCA